jgi:hypothetical protein
MSLPAAVVGQFHGLSGSAFIITCRQFWLDEVASSSSLAIWLSGFYHGNLTRRALVASTAAMPAAAALGLPVAQAAAEPDPIFRCDRSSPPGARGVRGTQC